MRSHARVVVIGGGVIGCSVLYHLTKLGWDDILLVERSELTSGSTWHAAAGFGVLSDSTSLARLNYYTIECYRALEAETGQSCGIHTTGSLYLAETANRVDQLRIMEAKARYLGFDFEYIAPSEIPKRHPFINTAGLQGAGFQPDEGHLDPSGITQAFARGARQAGAEIERFCRVVETNPRADGGWDVVTEKGTVTAGCVVNAAGLWAREVAAMAGIDLPVVPMEHQYFVTETIPEVAALDRELPSISDRDAEYYQRQEGKGFLVGAYEMDGKHWAEEGTPWDFGHELLPDDLERIADNVQRAMNRLPVLATAGIKRVINGPMVWSPDSLGLLGPVPGKRNYYSATGIMTGISQGGGIGKAVAEWIVEGEPEWDLRALDVARFGPYLTKDFMKRRSAELYGTRFRIHFPHEELQSGRPVRTRDNFTRQQDEGAVFTSSFGWETPLYFAATAEEHDPAFTFRRTTWFEPAGREARAARKTAGLLDTSPYCKLMVTGPGAEVWLDGLITNHVPKRDGGIALAPVVTPAGRFAADFTITRLAGDRFLLIGGGSAELYYRRLLDAHLPEKGVAVESYSERLCGISASGPLARAYLAELMDGDLSGEALPFLRAARMPLLGVPATVLRVSFTGDLGYEVYFPAGQMKRLYDRLSDRADDMGVARIGGMALNALRLEKLYGSWFTEFTPDYDPLQAGLGRFVKLEKPHFVGRDALLRLAEKPPAESLVGFEIDASDADAVGSEPILRDGRVVGEVTSGAFGYSVGKSLALGYIDTASVDARAAYEVVIIGEPRRARLLEAPPFDPEGARARA